MNFNPLDLIKGGTNPQQLAINLLQNQFKGTPMGDHILELAQKGDMAGLELIARNMCQQRGIDYDAAFNSFKQQIGVK